MAKTYVPEMTVQLHALAQYLVKYNSVIRVAINAIEPTYLPVYEDFYNAVIALDALRTVLHPLTP